MKFSEPEKSLTCTVAYVMLYYDGCIQHMYRNNRMFFIRLEKIIAVFFLQKQIDDLIKQSGNQLLSFLKHNCFTCQPHKIYILFSVHL